MRVLRLLVALIASPVLAEVVLGVSPVRADPFAALPAVRLEAKAPAPGFKLPNLENKEVRLGDLRRQVVLLWFFTTT